jgi:peptide/nickel transport system permease protein
MMPVLRIVGRRALQAALVASAVATLSFFLMRSLPGDPAFRVAAGRYGADMVTADAARAVRDELGLDRPAKSALLQWWGQLARLDFGKSTVSGVPVAFEVGRQMGHTTRLALAALVIASVLGIPLGLLAGLHRGARFDRATLVGAVLIRAMPPFLLGILLVIIFSLRLRVLPVAGFDDAGSIVLPALTLALGLGALSLRVTRDSMAAVRASAYFNFARTKGLTDLVALARHGLRNAAVPVVAHLGVQLAFLIEGVVVVETLFAWPGIGHALVHAVFARDVPMIQGAALAMSLTFVLLNTIVDLACVAIDPRPHEVV